MNLQIIDEKSLIKKYQHEIRTLKEELEQMQRGVAAIPQLKHSDGDDLVTLKQEVPKISQPCDILCATKSQLIFTLLFYPSGIYIYVCIWKLSKK